MTGKYESVARNNGGVSLPNDGLHPDTEKNLLEAMHGEAFAYIKYMLFADHARKSGNQELADLFTKTAHVERFEHFAEEAKLLGLVGSDEDNLLDSIHGETEESEHMYPEFAKKAATAGDKDVAERFKEISGDEAKHRKAYQSALDKLRKSSGRENAPNDEEDDKESVRREAILRSPSRVIVKGPDGKHYAYPNKKSADEAKKEHESG